MKEYRNFKVGVPWTPDKSRKFKRFGELFSQGKELFYYPQNDTLYADLNGTITNTEIGLEILDILGFGERVNRIIKKKLAYAHRISEFARLLEGVKTADYISACEETVDRATVAPYIRKDVKALAPTRLVIFTGTPQEAADMFAQTKLWPLYALRKAARPIIVYGTILEQAGGRLTGRVLRVSDERFRHDTEFGETRHALEKLIEEA